MSKIQSFQLNFILINILFIMILQFSTAQIFVDTSVSGGANDGSSWANAYDNLQDALDNAVSGDDIWVAQGTYKPSVHPSGCSGCSGSRDNTFLLKDGVRLYGGFDGTEVNLADRDVDANPTTLSGDIDTSNDFDDVHHVVTAVNSSGETAYIDGFTIIRGNANGTGSISINSETVSRDVGAGIYAFGGTTTITNCRLFKNLADAQGAGIRVTSSLGTISYSVIFSNQTTGTSDQGGGLALLDTTLNVYNNQITGNSSETGGGLYLAGGNNTVFNNTIAANDGLVSTGGLYLIGGNLSFFNNISWGNSSDDLFIAFAGFLNVNNNIIGSSPYSGGTLNLTDDPEFINLPSPGVTASGDFRLLDSSPAIDFGNNTTYQSASETAPGSDVDLDGNARLVNSDIDLGAYEFDPCPAGNVLYVNADATGLNTGKSWADAYTDLQDALASSCSNVTEIWVAEGTYTPSEWPAGCTGCINLRDYTFELKDGISL